MAPQPRLYISEDNSKRIYYPRKSKGKDKDVIPVDFILQPFICPVTGDTWSKRPEFWKHICEFKLEPKHMGYERIVTYENKGLMDKSHLEWLWNNYFETVGDINKLENLLGLINLELYIILLKVYNGDMDIDECLENITSNVEPDNNGSTDSSDTNSSLVGNEFIDELLGKFKKCDVFTPDNISERMSNLIHKTGTILEPSVGDGQLLKFIDTSNYERIDVYDIKNEYLDKIVSKNINKHHTDFITADISIKYDNIILNPPYIKIQDLSEKYRKYIRDKWSIFKKGNIDIYYAFLIKCIELLESDGVMVAITPNSYLYNKSSLLLREYFIKNKLIREIIDFKSEKVFDKVSTYCCITVFSKQEKDYFIYNDKQINYSTITNAEYNIFNTHNKIHMKTLDDVCNIKNGIATLRDKIYVHKSKLYDEPCWKEITNGDKDMWCIYPYDDEAVILDEESFKTNNPLTYDYLESNKLELSKRDKGNKTYPKWYSYGRTQSLKIPDKERIIYIPTLADPENIVYKIDKPKLHIGCLSLEITDQAYTLESIQTVLENNKQFIIDNSSKRGGGWLNMSSRIIKQIGIE